MVVQVSGAMRALKSFLQASGRLKGGVQIGEYKQPPNFQSAALFMGPGRVTGTTLTTTIEERRVVIRLYENGLAEKAEDVEFWLDNTQAGLLSDMFANFDLDEAGVREIDPLGVSLEPGFQTIGSTVLRVLDISVPLIIDDSATFTQ